jgi:hypothetical protein
LSIDMFDYGDRGDAPHLGIDARLL